MADLMLTRGPGLVDSVPVDLAAVSGGHIPIAECLLRHAWNVNGDLDYYGHVLGHALEVEGPDNSDFCRWLIDHGADVNQRQTPTSILCTRPGPGWVQDGEPVIFPARAANN